MACPNFKNGPKIGLRLLGIKEVTVGSYSYLVVNQRQKLVAPHSMGARRL
jgi:hypothetical protein